MAVPGTVTGVSVRNQGNGSVRVEWDATPTATSYKVYGDATTDPTTSRATGVTTLYYFDKAVGAGLNFFRIKATNGDGDSAAYSANASCLRVDTEGRSLGQTQKVDVVASVPVPTA